MCVTFHSHGCAFLTAPRNDPPVAIQKHADDSSGFYRQAKTEFETAKVVARKVDHKRKSRKASGIPFWLQEQMLWVENENRYWLEKSRMLQKTLGISDMVDDGDEEEK